MYRSKWIYTYFKRMAEENICQEFRLQMTDETRNCIIDKIKQNELVSKKLKKVYIALTLIRLDFLRVVFSWRGGGQFDPPSYFKKN